MQSTFWLTYSNLTESMLRSCQRPLVLLLQAALISRYLLPEGVFICCLGCICCPATLCLSHTLQQTGFSILQIAGLWIEAEHTGGMTGAAQPVSAVSQAVMCRLACQAVAIVGTAPVLMASTYASASDASMGPVITVLFSRLG